MEKHLFRTDKPRSHANISAKDQWGRNTQKLVKTPSQRIALTYLRVPLGNIKKGLEHTKDAVCEEITIYTWT